MSDFVFHIIFLEWLILYIGCILAAILTSSICGVGCFRLQKGVRLAQKIYYPAYGGMGPQSYDNNVVSSAQNTQMGNTHSLLFRIHLFNKS